MFFNQFPDLPEWLDRQFDICAKFLNSRKIGFRSSFSVVFDYNMVKQTHVDCNSVSVSQGIVSSVIRQS